MTKRDNGKRTANHSPADARGDFFFDELMTAQPDATREYLRERLHEIARRKLAGKED